MRDSKTRGPETQRSHFQGEVVCGVRVQQSSTENKGHEVKPERLDCKQDHAVKEGPTKTLDCVAIWCTMLPACLHCRRYMKSYFLSFLPPINLPTIISSIQLYLQILYRESSFFNDLSATITFSVCQLKHTTLLVLSYHMIIPSID